MEGKKENQSNPQLWLEVSTFHSYELIQVETKTVTIQRTVSAVQTAEGSHHSKGHGTFTKLGHILSRKTLLKATERAEIIQEMFSEQKKKLLGNRQKDILETIRYMGTKNTTK